MGSYQTNYLTFPVPERLTSRSSDAKRHVVWLTIGNCLTRMSWYSQPLAYGRECLACRKIFKGGCKPTSNSKFPQALAGNRSPLSNWIEWYSIRKCHGMGKLILLDLAQSWPKNLTKDEKFSTTYVWKRQCYLSPCEVLYLDPLKIDKAGKHSQKPRLTFRLK